MVSVCACCWQLQLYRYVLTCKMLCDACIWVHPNNKLSVCSIIMGPPTSHTNLPHQYSLHPVRTLSPPPLPSTPSPSVLPPPCKNPTVPFSLFTFNSHLPTHLTLMHSSPSLPFTPSPSHLILSPLQLPLVLQPMSQSTARHMPWSSLGVYQRKRTGTDRSLGSEWSCTAQDSQPSGSK